MPSVIDRIVSGCSWLLENNPITQTAVLAKEVPSTVGEFVNKPSEDTAFKVSKTVLPILSFIIARPANIAMSTINLWRNLTTNIYERPLDKEDLAAARVDNVVINVLDIAVNTTSPIPLSTAPITKKIWIYIKSWFAS